MKTKLTTFILSVILILIIGLLGFNSWSIQKTQKSVESVAEANKYLSDKQRTYSIDPMNSGGTHLNMIAFLYGYKNKVELYTDPQSYCDRTSTDYLDIDKDEKEEVVVSCPAGNAERGLHIYKIDSNGKVYSIGEFHSFYRDNEIKDVNSDGFLDVIENNRNLDSEPKVTPEGIEYKYDQTVYLWDNTSEAPGFRKQ